MSDESDGFAARAAKRGTWPVVRYELGAEPADAVSGSSIEERLDMMWPLALDAWASSGKPLPAYERSENPAKLIRSSDAACGAGLKHLPIRPDRGSP
jgi:hypothetical protein